MVILFTLFKVAKCRECDREIPVTGVLFVLRDGVKSLNL